MVQIVEACGFKFFWISVLVSLLVPVTMRAAEGKEDYYKILGVSRDATKEQIRKAYRQQAWKNHPDVNPGDAKAEARFKLAAEAYSTLSDITKRLRYDRYGLAGLEGVQARSAVRPEKSAADFLAEFVNQLMPQRFDAFGNHAWPVGDHADAIVDKGFEYVTLFPQKTEYDYYTSLIKEMLKRGGVGVGRLGMSLHPIREALLIVAENNPAGAERIIRDVLQVAGATPHPTLLQMRNDRRLTLIKNPRLMLGLSLQRFGLCSKSGLSALTPPTLPSSSQPQLPAPK